MAAASVAVARRVAMLLVAEVAVRVEAARRVAAATRGVATWAGSRTAAAQVKRVATTASRDIPPLPRVPCQATQDYLRPH